MSLDKCFQESTPVVGIRAMHLDCKGVPPTPSRLVELVEVAAGLRFNAIVVEWEDMFPWTVDRRIRCETAYAREDIEAFARRAAELGVEIIPLVQCLGHMEFVLKLADYAHLRELPDNVSCLNPLAEGSRQLVEKLVDEVLALLPSLKHFHLGGDEAWTFGKGPETKAYVDTRGKGALYLHHVGPILEALGEAGIRPMLWHDMMLAWDADALRRMGEKADLVVWGYSGDPESMGAHVNADVFKRFADCGVPLWGATAYKGADGHNVDLPNFDNRCNNAAAWAKIAGKYDLKGVITTAWSRYMHLELQCEPIDGALDSLAGHGFILHDGRLPDGGRDACVAALDSLGQKQRFEACRDALQALTDFRQAGWLMVQQLREELVVIQRDLRRHATAQMSLENIVRHVRKGRDIARNVQDALHGSIDPLWVQRYLDSRIEPLRVEVAEIQHLVHQAEQWARADSDIP